MSVSEEEMTTEVHGFCVWITTVEDVRVVEEFCAFVYFCPETVFFSWLSGKFRLQIFHEV